MFNVLIVGCGAIAGGYDADPNSADILTHAKAYSLHSGFKIVACVEPDAVKRRAFQERWNVPNGFARLDLVDVPFDVVSVCVPTELHADVLRAVLERKPKLVFAEKPLTDHLGTSQELVQAYTRAGVSLCVNHLRRWAPGIAELKAEIAQGVWGDFQGGTALYTKGLLNNGSHLLDILGFLLGPLQAVAHLRDADDGRDTDPTSDVIVAAEGEHILLKSLDSRAFTVFEIDLLFTGGRVTLTESSFTILSRSVEPSAKFAGYLMLAAGHPESTRLGQAMLGAVDNIYRHLDTHDVLASDGESALDAHRLCAVLAAMPVVFPRSK